MTLKQSYPRLCVSLKMKQPIGGGRIMEQKYVRVEHVLEERWAQMRKTTSINTNVKACHNLFN